MCDFEVCFITQDMVYLPICTWVLGKNVFSAVVSWSVDRDGPLLMLGSGGNPGSPPGLH